MNEEMKKILDALGNIREGIDSVKQTQEAHGQSIEEMGTSVTTLGDRVTTLEKNPADRTIGLPGVEDEKEKFSFVKAFRGILWNQWGKGFEKKVFEEAGKTRVMSAGDDAAGGYWVPPQILADFIELLRPNIVVEAAGATVIDDLVGSPVEIPKQTGGSTAYWVGENQDLTGSDVTAGQLKLEPHELGALVKMSARLLRLSSPGAEAIVRADMARSLAEAVDLAALRGTGSAAQPLGVGQTADIGTVAIGTNGGRCTLEIADKMRQVLAVANALKGKLGYVSHPTVFGGMRRERIAQFSGQTAGDYVFAGFSDAALKDKLGYPFFETTQIPTNLTKGSGTALSEVYYGNWSELIIGMWGGLELLASNVAADGTTGAFVRNQVWIRAIMEVDTAVRNAASFVLVNDADSNL